MELRAGYKWTDAGIIPDDWSSTTLGAICDFENGDRSDNYPPPNSFTHNGASFINAGHLVSGRIDTSNMDYISLNQYHKLGAGKVCSGDLLFCLRGSLGKYGIVTDGFGLGAIASSLIIIRPHPSVLDPMFLEGYIASSLCSRMVAIWAGGGAQPNLGARDLFHFTFPLPPTLFEQRAIATALGDMDALLDGLDRLIAKKRDLKQAAMQQLLTGQTRLPGFSGEWVVKRLDAVGEIRSGGTPSTTEPRFWGGGVPWCTPTDITGLGGHKYLRSTVRTITVAGLESSSAEVIPVRSLIVTSRATIGECAINTTEMTTNQGFKNIVPFAGIDVEFLYYAMTTQKSGLTSLCGGSTFLEISKRQLGAYKIRMPDEQTEQTAIAAIFSDMDAEITALEARRAKTNDLKQAMMQELLTGRTRLV